MTKWITAIVLVTVTLIGCSDRQIKQVDDFFSDVNNVAGGTQAVLQSPAGQAIPPDWKLYGTLLVMLANGAVITWQEMRNRIMKKTTKAIVKGIEELDNNDSARNDVKSNIHDAMLAQGGEKFYARANKIVDRLKIS